MVSNCTNVSSNDINFDTTMTASQTANAGEAGKKNCDLQIYNMSIGLEDDRHEWKNNKVFCQDRPSKRLDGKKLLARVHASPLMSGKNGESEYICAIFGSCHVIGST